MTMYIIVKWKIRSIEEQNIILLPVYYLDFIFVIAVRKLLFQGKHEIYLD